ncbi:MAG: type II secretion system protein [Acidobacteria bacterium]|nr:type II secretion system protein [Acidobacteriota bacterium]
MAALLVGMAVAAVLMTAVLPTWRQMIRREQEAELIFRGQQYVRAITLFQRRSGPGVLPPDVDTLVNGRFLRKKFKDPITREDFDLLSPAQAAGGSGAVPGGGRGGSSQPGTQPQTSAPAGPTTGAVIAGQPAGRGGAAAGGIIGVASKSKETSLRIYNGRTHYNEWQFVYLPQQVPGAGAPGQRGAGPGVPGPPAGPVPGGGGRQGAPPGGRGQPPTPGGRGSTQSPAVPQSPFGPRR